MKFHDLIKLNQATFMFKYVNAKLPPSFDDIFTKLMNFDRSLGFRINGLKREHLKTFATNALPLLWNNLPFELNYIATGGGGVLCTPPLWFFEHNFLTVIVTDPKFLDFS